MANKKLKGFSLAELLIALLVISIVLAAAIPTMTRKGKGSEQIWKWSVDATPQSLATQNEPNTFRTNSAYFGTGANQSVFIGSKHDPLSYAKVEDYFPDLDVDNAMDFTTLGDKLSLLKVGLKVDNSTPNTSNELSHFVNSHISFYNEPRITSTENETEYVGRIAMDQNNLAMGLGSMQSTLSEYTRTDTQELITIKGNTSVGHYSLFWNNLGMYNTAIGNQTLLRNSTGSRNTAIGSRACNAIDGSYNICIGAEAGASRNDGETVNEDDVKEKLNDDEFTHINYQLLVAADRETIGYNSGNKKPYIFRGGKPLITGISTYNGNDKITISNNNSAIDINQKQDDYPSEQEKQLVVNSRYFIVRPYNGEANHSFKITSDYYLKPVTMGLPLPTGESSLNNFAYTCYNKASTETYCKDRQPTNTRMELRLFEPSVKSNIEDESINFTVQQPYNYKDSTSTDFKYLDEVGIYSGFWDRTKSPNLHNHQKPKPINFNEQLAFEFSQNTSDKFTRILPREYVGSTTSDGFIYNLAINHEPSEEKKTINLKFDNDKDNYSVSFNPPTTPDDLDNGQYTAFRIDQYGTSINSPLGKTPWSYDAFKANQYGVEIYSPLNADPWSYVALRTNNSGVEMNRYVSGYEAYALQVKNNGTSIIYPNDPAYVKDGAAHASDALPAIWVGASRIDLNAGPSVRYNALSINENGLFLSSSNNSNILQIPADADDIYMPGLSIYSRAGSGRSKLVTTILDLDQRIGAVEDHAWSDIRLKNVSGDSTAGLKEINALEVKNYTYKADKNKTPHVGVIAQQLQKVFPNSVFEDKDGFLKIKKEEIFYAMVNSIKELSTKVQELTAKVQDLTAKIVGLDKRITELEKQNAELKKQNEEFEKRLEKLEKAIK